MLLEFDADPELGDHAWGLKPMHVAATYGWSDVIELLLERNARVDSRCNRYRTPLHYASQNGHIDCLRVLLDGGADLKLTDSNGWSCMLLVATNCHGFFGLV